MRITFSQATASTIARQWIAEIEALRVADGQEPDDDLGVNLFALIDNDHVNYSVNLVEADIVVDINDEMFLKYFSVVFKISRLLAPFIKPLTAVVHEWKQLVEELSEFVHARK